MSLSTSAAEAAQFDARFEAVDDILRGELYLAGGFATARAFIADRLPGMTEETVRDYAKVARYFTAHDVRGYVRRRVRPALPRVNERGAR